MAAHAVYAWHRVSCSPPHPVRNWPGHEGRLHCWQTYGDSSVPTHRPVRKVPAEQSDGSLQGVQPWATTSTCVVPGHVVTVMYWLAPHRVAHGTHARLDVAVHWAAS